MKQGSSGKLVADRKGGVRENPLVGSLIYGCPLYAAWALNTLSSTVDWNIFLKGIFCIGLHLKSDSVSTHTHKTSEATSLGANRNAEIQIQWSHCVLHAWISLVSYPVTIAFGSRVFSTPPYFSVLRSFRLSSVKKSQLKLNCNTKFLQKMSLFNWIAV